MKERLLVVLAALALLGFILGFYWLLGQVGPIYP